MDASITQAIIRCTNFAAIKHKNQRRKDLDATPYINHPIGVAFILTEEAGVSDISVIQAALLHDTVEDTDTKFEEIRDNFGEEVEGIVREVTDDKSLPKLARKNKQIVHAPHASPKAKLVKHVGKLSSLRDLTFNMSDLFTGIVREVTDDKSLPKLARKNKQIEHAPHASPKAKLVKLADKLYNLRDLKRQTPNGWTSERVQEYFEWAAKVVAGLRGSNKVIEDELDKLFRERNIPLN